MELNQLKSLEDFLNAYRELSDEENNGEMIEALITVLVRMFQMPNVPLEAKNICFFKRWSELQRDSIMITEKYIHQLVELNSILSESLREDLFLDMIWPQTQYDFESEEILNEYFNLIKILYYRNLTDVLKQFNMIDITKLMLKVTEFENLACCDKHKTNPNQQVVRVQDHWKINAFGLLIQNILQLAIMEYQRHKVEFEQLITMSIHHLLSFCTKEHSPCQVNMILTTIIKTLIKLDGELIPSIFQNFESVSYLVILFNSSDWPQHKVICLKMFHIISQRNSSFLQKIVVALLPPKQSRKVYTWLDCQQLFIALFEWLLWMAHDARITDHLMFDEKTQFRVPEVLELILSYLYLAPDMMRQYVVTTLLTLVKSNLQNQEFLAQHGHFLNTFPKFLLSYQSPDQELTSIRKSVQTIADQIFDASFRMVASVFLQQLQSGRIDLLFQWQKLVQLEIFKVLNDDQDRSCSDPQTPRMLIRSLYNYLFQIMYESQSLPRAKTSIIHDQSNQLTQRGLGLFMASFLQMVLNDLFFDTQIPNSMGPFNAIKYTPKIFQYKFMLNVNNQETWIDYQFLSKIIGSIRLITENIIQRTNFEATKSTNMFKVPEFMLWTNNLFRKVHGQEKDNISLIRIIQSLYSYYANYIAQSYFTSEKLDDLSALLRTYQKLVSTIISGAQQLKVCRQLSPEVEAQIKSTNYIYLELHMSLLRIVSDRCSLVQPHHQDYFRHVEEKQTLQELAQFIRQILTEYYQVIGRISLFYGSQLPQNIVWPICYELIRMRKQEGSVHDTDLQIIINQPDTLTETVSCEEMMNFILESPNSCELINRSSLNIQELMLWASAIINQQEKESIIQFQEHYSRQSQILMKDINQTLNKYQKIQQFNQDLFQQEKSVYDKSRTLSQTSN